MSSSASASSKLFQPIKVGAVQLQHRIVLAPLTRFKSTKKEHVPIVPLMKEYYSQRASRPGTLEITEATFIAPQAGGYDYVPGIWSDDQIEAWKEITDAIHARGSFIFLQMWALGRTAHPEVLQEDGYDFVAPSPIPLTYAPKTIPRELTVDEIKEYVGLYAQAAKNAVHKAGFDGVEIHSANGYLIDQFLQDVSNHRTDSYGGSVEKRSRFALEVIEAVTEAVGAEKTGIRFSPWSNFQEMGMYDPRPQYTHLVDAIANLHPSLAYIHLVEPRISGNADQEHGNTAVPPSNAFIKNIWAPRRVINAGGFTSESVLKRAAEEEEGEGELYAFGRHFIANPDLPTRIEKNIPLTPYNRDTFYVYGDKPDAAVGYIDYPFAESK